MERRGKREGREGLEEKGWRRGDDWGVEERGGGGRRQNWRGERTKEEGRREGKGEGEGGTRKRERYRSHTLTVPSAPAVTATLPPSLTANPSTPFAPLTRCVDASCTHVNSISVRGYSS